MAAKRATATTDKAPTDTEPNPSRTIKLERGKWYVGAADTSPVPVSFALDTIEEGLAGRGFGTIRFYRDASELPPATPKEVRDAKDANVWVSGQFLPPGNTETVDFVAPPGLLAVGELMEKPAQPGPIERRPNAIDTGTSTTTIMVATAALVVVGGGAIWLAWWLKKKRKKKNGKRRR